MQLVSDVGMSLELYIESKGGEIDQAIDYPLLKIIAEDSDETQYLEFNCNGVMIQLPTEKIKEFLLAAEEDVHSEAWYERNVLNNDDNT